MERTKTFEFQGRKYTIEFPNVGQYMDIETEKVNLSLGKWGDLISARTLSALRSIQIMECLAVLKVLCPKIFEDMNVSDYRKIDAKDFMLLVKVYNKEVSPWYSRWFKEFSEVLNDIDESEKKEDEDKVEK